MPEKTRKSFKKMQNKNYSFEVGNGPNQISCAESYGLSIP